MAANGSTIFYRDFAHAPSKVKATIEAVKNQFPDKKFIAVLELHTYSSLNETFIKEYKGAMDSADEASVFYSKHALELKRMPDLAKETVKNGFEKQNLQVFNNRADLENWLNHLNYKNSVTVFMSSGNYDGMDAQNFALRITQTHD